MKKLFRLFGLLIAVSTLMCLSSCGGITGTGTGEEENTNVNGNENQVISHGFYLSDDKGGIIYYTSTQSFNYGNHEDCIYQVQFNLNNSAATKGSWLLYTRPRGTTTVIDNVYEGTFRGVNSGSIRNGGTVELLIDSKVVDTLTVEKKTITTSKGTVLDAFTFMANVTASHKAIGATDAK